MGFMDKMTKTMNMVGEKTSEVANAAKLKLDISKVKGNIDAKYKELGELVYRAVKDERLVDEEVTLIVAEIDLLVQELNVMNAELELTK